MIDMKGWAERLRAAWEARANERQYFTTLSACDVCWEAAVHLALQQQPFFATELARCLSPCESPLERALMAALTVKGRERFGVFVHGDFLGKRKYLWVDQLEWFDEITEEQTRDMIGWVVIEPQVPVGSYRADIMITATLNAYIDPGIGNDHCYMTQVSRTIVVECDGQDFHDRTKQQIAHDRKRDRAMQAAGHMVFRFPGPQIWADPYACADEVFKAARDVLEKDEERLTAEAERRSRL
jgi:hypothetical protein